MTESKPSAEQAVRQALSAQTEATAAEIADAAGVGRSTANKVLARLQSAGEARRSLGGREEARRLPDRWAPGGARATQTGADTPPAKRGKRAGAAAERPATVERLRPGQLDDLVLSHLGQHKAPGPLSPTTVARDLGRSSGAVGNCLSRLANSKRVRRVSDKPRRCSLAA